MRGKITLLRETPKTFSTTLTGTLGNDLRHGKNEKFWIIRRLLPEPVLTMSGDRVMEESQRLRFKRANLRVGERVSVGNDGLINQNWLKIQSGPIRESRGKPTYQRW